MTACSILGLVGALGWGAAVSAAADAGFGNPQAVTIEGYAGSAMEPFITPDGGYLLFNTSNVAPSIPALQFATHVDAQTFAFQGAIQGEAVNESGVLSGTPTMDRSGDLYFVSPRSYSETLSTVYEGQFSQGGVTGVHLVPGVAGEDPGRVDFDAGVSPDGDSLYVSVGDFSGGFGPTSASVRLYERSGSSFLPDPRSATILHTVNEVAKLVYAAAIAPGGLEIFFTAASPAVGRAPTIYRAARPSVSQPFGAAERVAAISGFAEAPSISTDGTTLYYHALVGGEYRIETVTRAPAPAPTVTAVSPRKGAASGGTLVKIKGTNLAGAVTVSFGTATASDVQVTSATQITAVAPPATPGTVDVIVTTPSGSSAVSSIDRFKFVPTVTKLAPAGGPVTGGTTVKVTGSGFVPGTTATAFRFGAAKAGSVTCVTTTECTVTAPAHGAGTVDVTATVNGLTSAKNLQADAFTYY